MSAALHLAKPDDLPRLQSLVARFHEHISVDQSDDAREAALRPLLDGSPHGVAYLIGPRQGPAGYIIISFGYSVKMGGIAGFVDEFYIRPSIRGRGMGSEVLRSLMPALAEYGVMGLSLELGRDNPDAAKLYTRLGFEKRQDYHLMTCKF